MDIYEVGLRELSEYVVAYNSLPILKAKREEMFNSFYDECTSFYFDNSLGFMRKVTTSVEEAAIWVIEKKQEYNNLLQRTERKAEMLEIAIQTLTSEEQEIFYAHYLNYLSNLTISNEPLIQKICTSLRNQQIAYFKEKQRMAKQKRFEKARGYIA